MTAAVTEPVPSVLPEEGIDLAAELHRYRSWLIDQALARANGNYVRASALLGFHGTSTLWHYLKGSGKSFRKGRAVTKERREREASAAAETAPPAAPEPERAPAPEPELVTGLAARINWAQVAAMRAEGLGESRIAQKLSGPLGVHRFTVEKVLRQPRGLAKCGP